MKNKNELLKSVIPLICQWYENNKKMLPWRNDPTPYHVWISEIMLQQTRIEAVIPYYERFLSEFPTVASLAEASDERLMKLWQGLGYYSRARNLKKAAQCVMNEYRGEIPDDAENLRKLPGIGEYTAGAIASNCLSQAGARGRWKCYACDRPFDCLRKGCDASRNSKSNYGGFKEDIS